MSRKIKIFDRDGILTGEFHRLWHLITEQWAENADGFNRIALQWRTSPLAYQYPGKHKAAKEMIEKGIQIFAKHHSDAGTLLTTEIPGGNKSNRLNNQAIQPKSLRKEILQGADIKGNSSPGIAVMTTGVTITEKLITKDAVRKEAIDYPAKIPI